MPVLGLPAVVTSVSLRVDEESPREPQYGSLLVAGGIQVPQVSAGSAYAADQGMGCGSNSRVLVDTSVQSIVRDSMVLRQTV